MSLRCMYAGQHASETRMARETIFALLCQQPASRREVRVTPYYEHGGVTIYHGDCLEILPGLLDPDLIVTDPPYGISWSRGEHRGSRGGQNKSSRASKEHAGIAGDADTASRDAALAFFPDIPGICFGSFYAPFPADVKQVLIWEKSVNCGVVGSVTGFRRDAEPIFLLGPWPVLTARRGSVLHTARSQSHACAETGHPHTKPVELLRRLLECSPLGLVLDPFVGSGSTLVAAKELQRPAIGIEIEEKYCEIAAKRLSQEMLDFPQTPNPTQHAGGNVGVSGGKEEA